MRRLPRRPIAALAILVLLGLGVSAAFLLPSSGAQGTSTYTYPTKPTATKPTTTHESGGGGSETTESAETTTAETTTTATSTVTSTATSTSVPTTTSAAPVALQTIVRVRTRSNVHLHVTLLVDQAGMTLYHFTREKPHHVLCTGGCASAWPPLLVGAGGKVVPGLGVNRLRLGTVRRPDGQLQVTYAGLALYRFSGDTKPGDAKGQGFGHAWFAVGPSGRVIGG